MGLQERDYMKRHLDGRRYQDQADASRPTPPRRIESVPPHSGHVSDPPSSGGEPAWGRWNRDICCHWLFVALMAFGFAQVARKTSFTLAGFDMGRAMFYLGIAAATVLGLWILVAWSHLREGLTARFKSRPIRTYSLVLAIAVCVASAGALVLRLGDWERELACRVLCIFAPLAFFVHCCGTPAVRIAVFDRPDFDRSERAAAPKVRTDAYLLITLSAGIACLAARELNRAVAPEMELVDRLSLTGGAAGIVFCLARLLLHTILPGKRVDVGDYLLDLLLAGAVGAAFGLLVGFLLLFLEGSPREFPGKPPVGLVVGIGLGFLLAVIVGAIRAKTRPLPREPPPEIRPQVTPELSTAITREFHEDADLQFRKNAVHYAFAGLRQGLDDESIVQELIRCDVSRRSAEEVMASVRAFVYRRPRFFDKVSRIDFGELLIRMGYCGALIAIGVVGALFGARLTSALVVMTLFTLFSIFRTLTEPWMSSDGTIQEIYSKVRRTSESVAEGLAALNMRDDADGCLAEFRPQHLYETIPVESMDSSGHIQDSGIVRCPSCGMRVIPKSNGQCPSCQAAIAGTT